MTAYDATEWTEFFTASAGASAALAGLVFVAVSINVDRILQFKGLPERALATVLLLLSVVLVSLIGLIPGQGRTALAAELLGTGLVFAGFILSLTSPGRAEHVRSLAHIVSHWLLVALGTIPLVVGAVSLWAEAGGGLYWVAAGVILATAGAVANAWVLLSRSCADARFHRTRICRYLLTFCSDGRYSKEEPGTNGYPEKSGKARVRQGGRLMGFRLGPSNKGGSLPSWHAAGWLLAAIAVLTGLGVTAFTVFDLVVLAAVSSATTTASVLVVRRVRRDFASATTGPWPRLLSDSHRPRHSS